MQHSSTPWWRTESFIGSEAIESKIEPHAGPQGIALVRAWPSGQTDSGWGLQPGKDGKSFMPCYTKGEFNSRRVLFGYERDKWAFAFVMRSLSLVCIDIDGKNGGIESAKKLLLPPTLAETSKSGSGYHLFYSVDDTWDPTIGFGVLGDRIGFAQGVDFRGTGCVYHYKQQRWNKYHTIAPLPSHVFDMLKAKEQKTAASHAKVAGILASNDEMEILMLKDELTSELAKPIPAGKRNNSLFAIGSQMMTAGISDWDSQVHDRALALGLGSEEADKLVANIAKYAPVSP